MPRGGKRSGKPGAAYGARTDLNAAPRMAETGTQTTASAGVQAAPQPNVVRPDQTPNLMDPSSKPMTDGLPSGPGAGPSDAAPDNDRIIRKYAGAIKLMAQADGAPDSLRAFARWIDGVE